MSFFGPISLPGFSDTSAPLARRVFHRVRIVGNFAIVQAVVQCLGFISGIVLVRWLPPREYAYFTISNSMQATVNLLADIGISVGLVSIGGRVWQDRHRFGELIKTGLNVRRHLGAAAMLIVTPIMCAMLLKNGAPFYYTAIMIVIVLVGLLFQFSVGVLSVVPRLRSDVGLIQWVDFTGAIVRLALIGAVCMILNAGVAITVASVVFLLQYLMLHRYVQSVVDLSARENEADKAEMWRLTRHLAANAVFYCFQGQITVFLISFFAHHVTSVAEVGALGRLAMIFAVASTLLTNVFVPMFARCQAVRKLFWLYVAIVGAVGGFSLMIVAGAAFFPDQFLYVLGHNYSHLHRELLLMVSGSVIAALTGTFWALNASKAWIAGAWLYIPLTLVTQAILLPFVDLSSVSGVLVFNLFSAIPNLLLNIVMGYRGLRHFAASQ